MRAETKKPIDSMLDIPEANLKTRFTSNTYIIKLTNISAYGQVGLMGR
jgi:hypothetical protein